MYRSYFFPAIVLIFLAGSSSAYTPFLGDDEIKAIRNKIDQEAWAKKAFDTLLRQADTWTRKPIDIPKEHGGWSHDYVCPKHGVPLVFDEKSPHRHRCPTDNQRHTGDKLDAAWRFYMHSRYGKAVKDLGVAFILSNHPRYAATARAILLGYAENWPKYRNPRKTNGRGHLFWQVLDEGQWAPNMAWGYNSIYPALSPEDRQTIRNGLLVPLYEIIQKEQMQRIHNHRVWENAGSVLLGFATDHPDWFKPAIEGSLGIREQLGKGVLDDGLWFEGSTHYHFFTLEALATVIEVAHRFGYDLKRDHQLKAMFDVPLCLALPSGELPALNDSPFGTKISSPDLYELAFAWYGDSSYARFLQQGYKGRERTGLRALLYGKPGLAAPSPSSPPSSLNLTSSGVAILRKNDTYLLMKYGHHGGGHGHYDKLNFILAEGSTWLSPDFGAPKYGLPIYEGWFKQTLSHNTIVVDQKRQEQATGRMRAFKPDAEVPSMEASVDSAYPGVTLKRSLHLGEDYLVIHDRVESSQPHTYDWVYHHDGRLVHDSPFKPLSPPLNKGSGYEYLESLEHVIVHDPWQLTWQDGQRSVRLTMLGAPNTEVITAAGPGMPISDRLPMVIARRRATRAEYIAVLEWPGDAPLFTSVNLVDNVLQLLRGEKTIRIPLQHPDAP